MYSKTALVYYNIPTIYLTYGICRTTFFSGGKKIFDEENASYWKTYPMVYAGIVSLPVTIPIAGLLYTGYRTREYMRNLS